jgi:hypothetical protein
MSHETTGETPQPESCETLGAEQSSAPAQPRAQEPGEPHFVYEQTPAGHPSEGNNTIIIEPRKRWTPRSVRWRHRDGTRGRAGGRTRPLTVALVLLGVCAATALTTVAVSTPPVSVCERAPRKPTPRAHPGHSASRTTSSPDAQGTRRVTTAAAHRAPSARRKPVHAFPPALAVPASTSRPAMQPQSQPPQETPASAEGGEEQTKGGPFSP